MHLGSETVSFMYFHKYTIIELENNKNYKVTKGGANVPYRGEGDKMAKAQATV